MKRTMLIGPSQCGKASLTQYMRGEAPHYRKTRAIVWSPTAIDIPGEYLKSRCLYNALLASACEANIIALILNAGAPWSPFSPGSTGLVDRPVISLVTKADLANPQRISLVESWLVQAGTQKVFIASALEGTGVDEMFIFLNAKEPSCLTK